MGKQGISRPRSAAAEADTGESLPYVLAQYFSESSRTTSTMLRGLLPVATGVSTIGRTSTALTAGEMPSGGLVLAGCEVQAGRRPEYRATNWKYISLPRQMRGCQIGHSIRAPSMNTCSLIRNWREKAPIVMHVLPTLRASQWALCRSQTR